MNRFQGKSIVHRIAARSRNNSLFFKALELTGNNLEGKRWIFIVGCYNSGTTLLDQILSEHPNICGLPDEGVMLTNQLVKPEDFGWRRMWWKCEKEMENSNRNMTKSAAKIKRHWSHFYHNSEFLLEKSIANTCRIPFLNEEFQPAYFIHLVRNGYAVAEGISRKAQIIPGNKYDNLEKYPMELCIGQWVSTLDKIEIEKSKVSNFLEISYESLTENPKKVINKITGFIGLEPMDPFFFDKSFLVHEKSSEIKNMNEKSFQKLTKEEISIINSQAETYLRKYRYPIL